MITGISYFGGKSGSGTYQTIINQIPPHTTYVEGFAGMAGIFRRKLPAKESLLVEVDKETIARLVEIGINREMIYEGSMLEVLDIFRSTLDQPDVFLYLDPPYPRDSRKSDTVYRHELTHDNHVLLLKLIRSYQRAKIAISTYPNQMYAHRLKDWRSIEFDSQTRRGRATEVLIMNYPEPDELHDYRYLGSDYRERERITRKLNRWQNKFSELAPLEQKAMIQRLTTSLDPTAI
ncbi:hypothetical protein SAMN04487996_12285 [Dyadobacter soli]|uniref:D12 class N6 adenine-specific DNA methyltransferase n=1 Tax=Dyadobacter soli TaxID=659014 RepID=A0A1G7WKV9_9BACT|nr:hypothetical protein [Dyadobacter soli]SDG72572.1 hypothetical protein SAMN04487996_12285 [Dyadobacter soli]